MFGAYAENNACFSPRAGLADAAFTPSASVTTTAITANTACEVLYRNGLPVETEANNSLATANPLSYVTNGTSRSAVAGGYLQLSLTWTTSTWASSRPQTVFLRTRQLPAARWPGGQSLQRSQRVYARGR